MVADNLQNKPQNQEQKSQPGKVFSQTCCGCGGYVGGSHDDYVAAIFHHIRSKTVEVDENHTGHIERQADIRGSDFRVPVHAREGSGLR